MTREAVLEIARLAAGGDGVGEWSDGRVAFVPRTAPGDLVRARLVKEHRRFVRAVPMAILEPGPGRVEPRCRHYGPDRCGGCQLQHVDLDTQRRAKQTFVGDALRRIGRIDVEDPLVHPADHPWGYRNKLTLAFRDGPQPTAGFHAWDNPDVVFSLERCEIASPPLNRLWSALNPRLAAIPRGTARLVLREDEDGGCHITARDLPGDQWPSAEAVADALAEAGTAAALWIEPAGRAARRVAPRGADVPDSAQVFEQVNPVMGNRIRRRAVELLDAGPGVVVWDLYSGTGRATSLLASAGARVESIEQDQRAVALAGARGEGVHRHTGLVEQRLPTLGPVDRVLVNPPRTGLGPTVAGMLVDRRPGRIVYVSCDPATLARDVGVMTPAYRVTTVEAYDLFPQTAHVETVVALERREG